ncbi:hypothetical protein Btru_003466 [Bulinus truncatus]|nr:hypothetical protein Btru_003466 [Bulinus truncatus]
MSNHSGLFTLVELVDTTENHTFYRTLLDSVWPRINASVYSVNGSSSNSLDDLLHAATIINDVYLWIILGFGFPGNILAIFTVLRMRPRVRFTFYVAALAFVDNLCLTVKVVYINLDKANVNLGQFGCQFLQYLGTFSGQWANWILVMMTAERLVDIALPLVSRRINKRHYVTVNGVIAVVLLGVNGPIFHLYYLSAQNGVYSCSDAYDQTDGRYRFVLVNSYVEMVVFSLLPVLLLTIMNCFIVRILYTSSHSIQRDFSVQRHVVVRRRQHQKNITVTTVLTCIVFCILVFPRPVFTIVQQEWEDDGVSYNQSLAILLEQIFFFMSDSCHAVNFYVYFVSNRMFRRQLLETLKPLFQKFSLCTASVTNRHKLYSTNDGSTRVTQLAES